MPSASPAFSGGTGGALLVWAAVVALAIYAIRRRSSANQKRPATLLIIGGGAIVPTVVLTILLVYGLAMLPKTIARAPEGSLRIAVTGEQWWWQVRYQPPDGEEVVLANEIRIPVDEPVEFELDGPPIAVKGQEFFCSYGCSACHTIRGTTADGVVGPDLTHGGSRLSVGAGIFPNEPQAFQEWIAFGMLPPEELRAIATYLESFK
ncbi:MAG: hypothetical protein M3461_09110 [Pseudomonadota bacterium]|nr:hypothetical protein [Pseudomonadota bacterium]